MIHTSEFLLSTYDLCIVHDKAFFMAKHAIMEKWERFLSYHAEKISQWLSKPACKLPDEVKSSTPKISKGENYQGLPYMVLDYPRLFTKQDTCAFRNILLWNRGLYSTWFFEGRYIPMAVSLFSFPSNCELFLHQSVDKWTHELLSEDILLQQTTALDNIQKAAAKLNYLKISSFLPFEKWNTKLENENFAHLETVWRTFSSFGGQVDDKLYNT
ncbi:MAG: hypothetical protein NZ519_11000 [Bacteroidia bacterium]|nr:hypothetical protein [Bacteroidia bacterium]MDW8302256.1 hypothetical protein [Bacteroidia bacterium]